MTTSKKITRFDSILEKIPEAKKDEAKIIVDELNFYIEQLDDLKKKIRENGSVEHFKQGVQEFDRESPASKAYTTYAKQYNVWFKDLLNLVPKNEVFTDDEIDEKFFK